MRTILLLILCASSATAQLLTHYGSTQDSTSDPNSAAGIGNHQNRLVPLQSAALSDSVARQYGIGLGQSFSVTAGGNTYNLIYDDRVPTTYKGQPLGPRVDIYDPNNVLGGANSFSAPVTSVDNGPVLFGNGVTNGADGAPSFTHTQLPPIVSTLLSKFQNAGKTWATTIKNAATSLFWILALISLVFTGVFMLLRRAELLEITVELVRYILFTGFFYWLLVNGPDFAGKIIASLWQLGGQASGTGNSIFPGDIFTLGMQVLQGTLAHIEWWRPETVLIPVIIALIIFIVCTLVAANVVLLLCAAWVVLLAGLIFLGFGGCRWTSDMAINYYRTMLGIGVSLMTMLLVVGVGINFLQNLVTTAGQTPDIPSLAAIMGATILLAVISHQLPRMVASIATGGGYGGAVGSIGMMAFLGTAIAAASIARGVGAVATTAPTAHDKMLARIQAGEKTSQASSRSNGNTAWNPPVRDSANKL